MRSFRRSRARNEEEESVFVTMTDMTVSFLFIIMILLAFFATQINEKDTVPRDQYDVVLEQLDVTQKKVVVLQAQLEAFTAKVVMLERALAGIRVQLRITQAERDQLQRDKEALVEQLLELQAKAAQCEAELIMVRAERDALQQLLARLRQVKPLEAYLAAAIEQRHQILVELRDRLKVEFPDLKVVISDEHDALRFQGEGLFRSGSSRLGRREKRIVKAMGSLLDEILACYTLGTRAAPREDCKSGYALIEAVQIEGHTDTDGSRSSNLRLSTDRANSTFLVMLDEKPLILEHRNLREQPVMSVSGYGEMRPLAPNQTLEEKSSNRRIDLRIIMYAPSDIAEIAKIKLQLDTLRTADKP